MKKKVLLCFFIIILVFGFIGCNGGNNLNGTWEDTYIFGDEYVSTIVFNGKNFTINGFTNVVLTFRWEDTRPSFVYFPLFIRNARNNISPFEENIIKNKTFEESNMYSIGWKNNDAKKMYEDKGGERILRNIWKGTYSISEDKIEFLFSNGSIEVFTFTRTENTINIDESLFTRKM